MNPHISERFTGLTDSYTGILNQARLTALDTLSDFAGQSHSTRSMHVAFGRASGPESVEELLERMQFKDASLMPNIEILPSRQLKSGQGAFSNSDNTIYLSNALLQEATRTDDIAGITSVLLEETGHYFDSLLNSQDSPGDEGEIFSKIVQGEQLSSSHLNALKLENDVLTLTIDGQNILVEMSRIETIEFKDKLYQSMRGTDDQIFIRSSTDGENWGTWQDFGGRTSDDPEFEVFGDKLIQSVRGTDNGVYTRYSHDGINWSQWQWSGKTLDAPEMEVFNDQLYQTIRGADNQVYTRSTENGTDWTAWVANGATLDTPELEVLGNRLYQTVRGTDNQVYTRSTGNGTNWTGWVANGATLDTPELEAFNGRLYQTIQGTDNQVYIRSTFDGTAWTPWVANGATLDAPELEVFNGRLYQSIQGTDNQVYTRSSANGSNWTSWTANGATLSTPHLAVYDDSFIQSIEGTDAKVYNRSLTNTSTSVWGLWKEVGGRLTAHDTSRIDLNDFNGDDKTDVIWRDPNGKVILWLDRDHTKRVEIGQISRDYTFQGTGDFNRDGHVDIMWRKNTGEVYAWYMNGTQFVSSEVYGGYDPSATVQGFADLNKDGKTDVIWRLADGNVVAWYDRDHTQRSVLQWAAPDITFQGTGDFNADGNTDLMWRKNSGEVYVWYMNSSQFVGDELYGGYDPSATLQGFADLNKDGKTDVIWRLANGDITAWYDRDHTQRSVLGQVGSDVTFQITGDFNADGNIDLMWRKNTGEVYAWYMVDTQLISSDGYGGYLPDYQMQVPIQSPSKISANYLSELTSMTDSNWDWVGGESAQYGEYESYTVGDIEQQDMSPTLLQVYRDLSTSIFGTPKLVTTGYAFDASYAAWAPSQGIKPYHAGIDIGASNETVIKSATNGIVATTYFESYGGVVGIDETDNFGNKTGRRWWYVHNSSNSVQVGQSVFAGVTEIGKVGSGHLHLAVTDLGQMQDPGNGNTPQEVIDRTMSPLQAFWKYKNNLR